jgi:hypothetical protein
MGLSLTIMCLPEKASFLDSVGHGLGGRTIDIGTDRGCAALCQKSCDGLADSWSGPGDDGDPSV